MKKFFSLVRVDTDQGWVPLLWGNHSNLSPHDISYRGGPLDFFREWGTISPIGGKPLANVGLPGWMNTNHGRKNLGMGDHRQW